MNLNIIFSRGLQFTYWSGSGSGSGSESGMHVRSTNLHIDHFYDFIPRFTESGTYLCNKKGSDVFILDTIFLKNQLVSKLIVTYCAIQSYHILLNA